jgi:hemolysin III
MNFIKGVIIMFKFREPVSGLTHLFGALASAIGMILLIQYSILVGNVLNIIVSIIFGISLILLYSASTVYHLTRASEKAIKVLRRIDHSMIYVLIAGTYTPICLIGLKGTLGWTFLISIWTLTIAGILLKIFWFNAPRWLYTFFYVLMGWLAVFAIYPLIKAITLTGVMWLVAGGISYTLGAVIYATKWPKITSKLFGFHEIFHIFVLIGSACHYWLVFRYLVIR